MSNQVNDILMDIAREQMEEDKDWQEHTDYHHKSPRSYCPYCAQNADVPQEEEREEQYV